MAAVTVDPDGKEADLATNEARKPFFAKARDTAIEDILKKVCQQIFRSRIYRRKKIVYKAIKQA